MSSDRPQQTLADYLAIAVSPVLIMALVGSLVFFLLKILYAGAYEGRLQWIVFFAVFAMVLIARISMEGASDRAGLYGLALAGAVWLGLQQFVQYPPGTPLAEYAWAVNLLLMGIIWWCANRLTWDCTLIDDKAEASGAGLLQSAGLDQPPEVPVESAEPAPAEQAPENKGKKPPTGLAGWLERYRRYREERKSRPRNPGVWVVYFSLAALPLFGLGQSLIPASDLVRRRAVFWLMVIYVGSGLGLLLTTSFLGLRRYLRQRKLQMPPAMTGLWVALGTALIVVLLAAGAFLPRPNAEYPLVDLGRLTGSPDRKASPWAIERDSAGKGEGSASSDQSSADPKGAAGSGDKQGGQEEGQIKGKSSPGSSQDSSGTGQGEEKPSQGRSPSQAASGKEPDKAEPPGQNPSKQGTGRPENPRSGSAEKKPDLHGNPSSGAAEKASSPPRSLVPSFLTSFFAWLAPILKWIVFALLALAVGFVVLRALLQFLANFTLWARSLLAAWQAWWRGLAGWWHRDPAAEETEEAASQEVPRPFASFANPFRGGADRGRSPEELVRYSFEALEALAWERGLGRQPDETPLEFAGRFGAEIPGLEADVRRLASLYVRAAYAGKELPAGCLATLRQFWEHLDQHVEAPLSA